MQDVPSPSFGPKMMTLMSAFGGDPAHRRSPIWTLEWRIVVFALIEAVSVRGRRSTSPELNRPERLQPPSVVHLPLAKQETEKNVQDFDTSRIVYR
jgi:hypothetical protein